MAEFLVYNKEHWMDNITPERFSELVKREGDEFIKKYNSRYQKGDIIEVRPDGFWTDGRRKGFGSEHFALVCVPGLSVRDAQKYTEAVELDGLPVKRRRYAVKMAEVSLDVNSKVTIAARDIVTKLDDKSTAVIIG